LDLHKEAVPINYSLIKCLNKSILILQKRNSEIEMEARVKLDIGPRNKFGISSYEEFFKKKYGVDKPNTNKPNPPWNKS